MRQLLIILFFWLLLITTSLLFFLQDCNGSRYNVADIRIFADSVINDVSHHPIGINIDYFMDDDNYLKPNRGIAEALGDLGVRYLRYPGGNKSDFYFFSQAPWEKSKPTLARTGKGAVGLFAGRLCRLSGRTQPLRHFRRQGLNASPARAHPFFFAGKA